MSTYQELLEINEQYAVDNGKEASAIKRLLLEFSNLSSTELYLNLEQQVDDSIKKRFMSAVDQYIIYNVPVQHIIGYEYFYGYQFHVSKDVLIPRRETEELVAYTLEYYDEIFDGKEVDVLDIGTGSGCMAITLSKEESNMNVDAVDISKDAIQIALKNNDELKSNVRFLTGDLFQPVIDKKYDIIISNPPYIPIGEEVESIVLDNEPEIALFGGDDGLDFYKKILEQSKDYIKETYMICFEHAFNKAKEIRKLAEHFCKGAEIVQKKDMQGKDRMTFIIKK